MPSSLPLTFRQRSKMKRRNLLQSLFQIRNRKNLKKILFTKSFPLLKQLRNLKRMFILAA